MDWQGQTAADCSSWTDDISIILVDTVKMTFDIHTAVLGTFHGGCSF